MASRTTRGPHERAEAFALLTEYTQSQSLIKHMLSVEAAMRAYARKLGEDEERWGIVGLLHDFDYERWPDPPDHPLKGRRDPGPARLPGGRHLRHQIARRLFCRTAPACTGSTRPFMPADELCGLVTAAALVRPAGITDLTAASVKKKMKSKGFAPQRQTRGRRARRR